MKRTPLARKAPLRAKRWGIARKAARRLSRPGADPAYLDFVRTLPCSANALPGHMCWPWDNGKPVMDANHARYGVGMGLKAKDRDTFPLCRAAHDHWHDATGPFKGWRKAQRREWEAACVRWTQRRAPKESAV